MFSPKTKIPARNLVKFDNGLLPGDIILLWRINFGTFTNESVFPKYFWQDYGIDAPKHLRNLIKNGFVEVQDVFDALEDHATVVFMKDALSKKGISGLSKENRDGLLDLMEVEFSARELEKIFKTRGYFLTEKGEKALKQGKPAVDKHPKKKY